MRNSIAIIGDFDPNNRSHVATSEAIGHSLIALNLAVEHQWIGTEHVAAPGGVDQLAGLNGLWIAPASPYKSMEGALLAIRRAREAQVPLLGTCGGFQHIILEYARNVLGITDAQHEESEPNAPRLIISRLACSLMGRMMTIKLKAGSLAARSYGRTTIQEQYHCNFGVNPDYIKTLRSSSLRIVGSDDEGEVRVVELAEHPFFIGTLFLPQLSSTTSQPHPLVSAFVRACCISKGPKTHSPRLKHRRSSIG